MCSRSRNSVQINIGLWTSRVQNRRGQTDIRASCSPTAWVKTGRRVRDEKEFCFWHVMRYEIFFPFSQRIVKKWRSSHISSEEWKVRKSLNRYLKKGIICQVPSLKQHYEYMRFLHNRNPTNTSSLLVTCPVVVVGSLRRRTPDWPPHIYVEGRRDINSRLACLGQVNLADPIPLNDKPRPMTWCHPT